MPTHVQLQVYKKCRTYIPYFLSKPQQAAKCLTEHYIDICSSASVLFGQRIITSHYLFFLLSDEIVVAADTVKTAPGPSGLRADHIKTAIMETRDKVGEQLLTTLAELVQMFAAGRFH